MDLQPRHRIYHFWERVMIFDKAVLLSCAGGDKDDVLKCTWTLSVDLESAGKAFFLTMDRSSSTDPNCWLYNDGAIYDPEEGLVGLLSICVPMPLGYYDSEDVSGVELSIGGWSGFPFEYFYSESEPYKGDGEYGIYSLQARFDDGVPIPAFSNLVDGKSVTVTVKIKGLGALQGS